MCKNIVFSLVFALVFAISLRTFAQTTDSGTYVVYVGDQAAADEIYASEKLSDGSVRTVSKVGATTYITTTKNDKPIEFAIESNGSKILTTTFASGEAKTKIGEQPEKILKSEATVITENNVWSNFINLLAQYDAKKSGAQNLTAFLPSRMLNLAVVLEKVENKDFKTNDRTISLSKYKLTHTESGLELIIWADKSNVPYLIDIPAQQAQIVRKGFEEIRKTAAPTELKTAMKTFSGDFKSEEVVFPNGSNTLAGTLTVPVNGKKTFPALVIITGSGGQDRDGSTIFNLYKQIAESLARAGVAVLRVDDRGSGKSTIDMTKAADTSYRDLISDSRAAFDFLKTRKEIDRAKIGLIGHSEGAETALTIASEDKSVAAVVLMAGVSGAVDEGLEEQELYQRALQGTLNAADKTKIMPLARMLLNQFEAAKLPQNATNAKLDWFRQHLASNPSALAANVKCPVLILQGERDAQVLAYHSIKLAKVLSNSGNKDVSLRIFPNLTHLFTPISDKPEESSKISADLLLTLQNWANATLVDKP
jgi:dienelactone hydrolase